MKSIVIKAEYLRLLEGDMLAAACLSRIQFFTEGGGKFTCTKKQWADAFCTTEGRVDKALHKLDKLKYIRIGWVKPPGGYRISSFYFQESVVNEAIDSMNEIVTPLSN